MKLQHLLNIVPTVLATAEKQGKEIKMTSIGQRETKLSLFTDDIIVSWKLKQFYKLYQLIKVSANFGYKINL